MELAVNSIIWAIYGLMCFICGAKVVDIVHKGKEIKAPEINPLKAYREHEERKAHKAEQERNAVIMQNIEAYDGTSAGQMDVPRG